MRFAIVVSILLVACGSSSRNTAAPARPSPVATPTPAPTTPPAPKLPVAKRDVQTLARDCDAKDYDACAELAQRYEAAIEVDHDPRRALELRKRACDANHAAACGAVGSQLKYGGVMDRDEALGQKYYERGCDGGDARSCEAAAKDLATPKRDELYARAFDIYLRGCNAGSDVACFGAHSMHYNRRVKTPVPDPAWRAVHERADKACAAGTSDACWTMWRIYDDGLGVTADDAAAARYRDRGCELGDGSLCGSLARLYEIGKGVGKDAERAKTLQLRSCKLGNRYGCYFAANVETDAARRLELQRRACDLGDLGMCDRVIAILDKSDPQAARTLRERTCRRNWMISCLEIAEQLRAQKRDGDAMPWLDRACHSTNDEASAIKGCSGVADIRNAACARGNAAECRELETFLATLPVDRRVAVMYECCSSRPEFSALPGGALLLFFDAVADKNLAAVKAMIHPKQGLKIRIGWHDEDGSDEDITRLRSNTRTLGRLPDVSRPPIDTLTCEPLDGDGPVSCSAFGGGYGASFELLRELGRFYVTSISEEGH